MKIKFIVVGKLKEKYLVDCCNEYLKRLSKYTKTEVIEIEEEKISDESSAMQAIAMQKEGFRVLEHIDPSDYVILCDLHGEEIDSVKFSSLLEKAMTQGTSTFCIIIGGSYGLDDVLRRRSNFALCLSKMTFPHQLTRVIILEQIYRAMKILHNEKYHK